MAVAVGTSSWTDPTLTRDADWYPKRSSSAEERLRFYASVFPVVEVDATYYAPPSKDNAQRWVERTPPGFRFEIKAYSLFTQHPTNPKTLWDEVAAFLPDEERAKSRVYPAAFPDEAIDRAWEHFADGLIPLREAGKLGAVVFQFPPWFTAKRANRAYLASLPGRLPGHRIAVEFRHASWMGEDDAARTLALLEEHDLAYVCVDEPQGFKTSVPPVVAATSDLALVRFHGHNDENWDNKGITAAERFQYLYDDDELATWVEPLRRLEAQAGEAHALMNNCYRDFGVRNARRLGELLGEGLQPDAPPTPT